MRIRTQLKAGGWSNNHNEALRVRTALKAGGIRLGNHNEALRGGPDREAISMRRQVPTTTRKDDRLELLVIRAGLRAGARLGRRGIRR